MIEKWTQDQALLFLGIALVLMLIEISALLSTVLACTKTSSKKKTKQSNFTSTQTLTRSPFSEIDHDYGNLFYTRIIDVNNK